MIQSEDLLILEVKNFLKQEFGITSLKTGRKPADARSNLPNSILYKDWKTTINPEIDIYCYPGKPMFGIFNRCSVIDDTYVFSIEEPQTELILKEWVAKVDKLRYGTKYKALSETIHLDTSSPEMLVDKKILSNQMVSKLVQVWEELPGKNNRRLNTQSVQEPLSSFTKSFCTLTEAERIFRICKEEGIRTIEVETLQEDKSYVPEYNWDLVIKSNFSINIDHQKAFELLPSLFSKQWLEENINRESFKEKWEACLNEPAVKTEAFIENVIRLEENRDDRRIVLLVDPVSERVELGITKTEEKLIRSELREVLDQVFREELVDDIFKNDLAEFTECVLRGKQVQSANPTIITIGFNGRKFKGATPKFHQTSFERQRTLVDHIINTTNLFLGNDRMGKGLIDSHVEVRHIEGHVVYEGERYYLNPEGDLIIKFGIHEGKDAKGRNLYSSFIEINHIPFTSYRTEITGLTWHEYLRHIGK